MSTQDVIINRDMENDIVYAIKGGVNRAATVNISAGPDILVRLDSESRKVVGITIEDFSEVMPQFTNKSDYELMEIFDGLVDVLEGCRIGKRLVTA